MLYQLRKLSASEQEVMLKSPVWVALLVACSDQHLHQAELETTKKLVHIKTFSERSDVRNLYIELDRSIDVVIESESHSMPHDPAERILYFEKKLFQLNDILPKLEHRYALQFYNSLKDLAMHIAKSEGGVLGIGDINEDEAYFIQLPMINKP